MAFEQEARHRGVENGDAGFRQRTALRVGHIHLLPKGQDGQIGRIGAQQERLLDAAFAECDQRHLLADHLVRVADRAVAHEAASYGVAHAGQLRLDIEAAGRQQHAPGEQGASVEDRLEAARGHRREGLDLAGQDGGAKLQRLLAEPPQPRVSGQAVGGAGQVVRPRDPSGAAGAAVDHRHAAAEPGKVDGRRQPGWTGPDDEAVYRTPMAGSARAQRSSTAGAA